MTSLSLLASRTVHVMCCITKHKPRQTKGAKRNIESTMTDRTTALEQTATTRVAGQIFAVDFANVKALGRRLPNLSSQEKSYQINILL